MTRPPSVAAGPVADEPVYLRWENTAPPHRKFYEVELELSLFYSKVLTRRWGRIGAQRVRSLQLVMVSAEAVAREVTALSRRRGRHGYALVKEISATAGQYIRSRAWS